MVRLFLCPMVFNLTAIAQIRRSGLGLQAALPYNNGMQTRTLPAGLQQLNDALAEIQTNGSLPALDWPESELSAAELGLQSNSQAALYWPQAPDYLDSTVIQAAFPQRQVMVFHAIDSTNTYLLKGPCRNTLCTAELQTGGRGRRGRGWVSPYARNLAMSMGFASQRPIAELGGLSTVVGLALVAGLETLGGQQVGLKWPNDVLVDGRKLCGILVDLANGAEGLEFVVGIGVNVRLDQNERDQIGQPAMDLATMGIQRPRTELLVTLLQQVQEFISHFETAGFAPFVQAFDDAHIYHAQPCQVHVGEQVVDGLVKGIGAEGELILETDQGEQRYHGGEVSLRPSG